MGFTKTRLSGTETRLPTAVQSLTEMQFTDFPPIICLASSFPHCAGFWDHSWEKQLALNQGQRLFGGEGLKLEMINRKVLRESREEEEEAMLSGSMTEYKTEIEGTKAISLT